MNKKLVIHCTAFAMMCLLLAGWACNNSTSPKTTSNQAMVVLQPTAGQTFKAGDTMKINWQINDTNDISSVVVQLYRDSLNHDSLATTITAPGLGSFPTATTSYAWVIPSTTVAAHYYIRVYNYTNATYPPAESSGVFSITN